MRSLLIGTFACMATLSLAQTELVGPGRFPETRTLSGMSGGGFGVTKSGHPSIRGAMALSTPIAYGLGHWHWALTFGASSPKMEPRFLDLKKDEGKSDGTASLMAGIPTPYGPITWSLFFPSVDADEVTSNIQFSPDYEIGGFRFAVGVQDAGDTTGTFQPFEPRSARSFYGVATYEVQDGTHVSVGFGDQRFGGVFGNVSTTLGNDWKILAEYDTYNWNYGVGKRLGDFSVGRTDRKVEATAFFGYVRGKYATWSLSFAF